MTDLGRAEGMGLRSVNADVDLGALRTRIGGIEDRLESSVSKLLSSQDVRIIRGRDDIDPQTMPPFLQSFFAWVFDQK